MLSLSLAEVAEQLWKSDNLQAYSFSAHIH